MPRRAMAASEALRVAEPSSREIHVKASRFSRDGGSETSPGCPRRRTLCRLWQWRSRCGLPVSLGLLALILTVGAVQTVGAAILPGCLGFRAAVLKVRIHLPPAESLRTIGPS